MTEHSRILSRYTCSMVNPVFGWDVLEAKIEDKYGRDRQCLNGKIEIWIRRPWLNSTVLARDGECWSIHCSDHSMWRWSLIFSNWLTGFELVNYSVTSPKEYNSWMPDQLTNFSVWPLVITLYSHANATSICRTRIAENIIMRKIKTKISKWEVLILQLFPSSD